jgi:hypothetical protein
MAATQQQGELNVFQQEQQNQNGADLQPIEEDERRVSFWSFVSFLTKIM